MGSNESKPQLKVEELKCAEVRWFYRRKDGDIWVAFKGYDSTFLEIAYRKANNVELDEATKQILSTFPEKVIVLDGYYCADEALENINAIYWKEDSYQIQRGTWFYANNMQPLPPRLADAIEAHHLKCFKGNVIPESTSITGSDGKKVYWNSLAHVHIRVNGNLIYFNRSFVDKAMANPAEGRPNFSDLILVIHGVGHNGKENSIAENTAKIRGGVLKQMEEFYPNEERRPAILPIHWRTSLRLDNGLCNHLVLPSLPKLAMHYRNSHFMDLMYYQSPEYRIEIVDGVIKCLNNVYFTFIEYNPHFSGPVSIVGHSLGSVIVYDILTNYGKPLPFFPSPSDNQFDEAFPLSANQFDEAYVKNGENIYRCFSTDQKRLLKQFHNGRREILQSNRKKMGQNANCPEKRLKFRVKFLFCLGSPLSVFCIMNGVDYKTVIPKPHQVERIFNIFHPSDPVAHRIEPMFHENYKHIKPLEIFNHRTSLKNYKNYFYKSYLDYLVNKCDLSTLEEAIFLLPQLIQYKRIDFQVQSDSAGLLDLLTSHSSYWENLDVAAFLLNAIYPPTEVIVRFDEY